MLFGSRLGKKGRIFVALYLAAWLAIILYAWFCWNSMAWWSKSLIVILELLFIPDIRDIKRLFTKPLA